MKYLLQLAGILVVTVLALVPTVTSEIPQLINYQAVLLDPDGAPLRNDTATVSFSIYGGSNSGIELWTERALIETDRSGGFSVLLGATNPIPDTAFAGSDTWLGITVRDDPEMTPRARLVSVPYTFRALTSDTARFALDCGASDDGDWAVSGDTIFRLTGLIGIGTSSPSVPLDITQRTRIGRLGFVPNYAEVMFNAYHDGTDAVYALDGSAFSLSHDAENDRLHFKYAPPGDSGSPVSYERAMVINSTGNVGIGMLAPAEKLSVAGVIESTSGGIKFPDGSVQTAAASGSGNVSVKTGTANHNDLITPPSGYSVGECHCIVSPHTFGPMGSSSEGYSHWCYVSVEAGGWRVYAQSRNTVYGSYTNDVVNYMVIGTR